MDRVQMEMHWKGAASPIDLTPGGGQVDRGEGEKTMTRGTQKQLRN